MRICIIKKYKRHFYYSNIEHNLGPDIVWVLQVIGELKLGLRNWDCLSSVSHSFKSMCDSFILTQLGNSPKSTSLLDLFLTNSPHEYSCVGIFAHDMNDHCVFATVR